MNTESIRNLSHPQKSEHAPPERRRSTLVVLTTTIIAVALVVVGRVLIGVHASSVDGPAPKSPIAVSVIPVSPSSAYERQTRHVGLVEPSRQTNLAFELGGTLLEVLVEEGDRVQQGDLIARLDTRALEADREAQLASRAALLSDLERAQLALERVRSLQERDFSAGQSLDDARLAVSRSEAMIRQVEASIDALDISLDKAVLKAPFDAEVGAQSFDEGSTVGSGVSVASLFEWESPMVRIGLPVDDGRQLLMGTVHRVEVDGHEYSAEVISKRRDVSARTRTIDVLFQLDTSDLQQPAFGQTAELNLRQTVEQSGYRVPVSALTEGEAGLWSVLLAVPDEIGDAVGQVVREHVDVLNFDGNMAYVAGDLPAESGIIQAGAHRVVVGQLVQSIAAAP